MIHNVKAMSLTLTGPGVYSYGIHKNLNEAPTEIIFSLLYDTDPYLAQPIKVKLKSYVWQW